MEGLWIFIGFIILVVACGFWEVRKQMKEKKAAVERKRQHDEEMERVLTRYRAEMQQSQEAAAQRTAESKDRLRGDLRPQARQDYFVKNPTSRPTYTDLRNDGLDPLVAAVVAQELMSDAHVAHHMDDNPEPIRAGGGSFGGGGSSGTWEDDDSRRTSRSDDTPVSTYTPSSSWGGDSGSSSSGDSGSCDSGSSSSSSGGGCN